MCGVAGQKHAVHAESIDHPHIDPIERDPSKVMQPNVGATGAPFHKRLHRSQIQVWNIVRRHRGHELVVLVAGEVP